MHNNSAAPFPPPPTPPPAQAAAAPLPARLHVGLNLFWRTFFMLALLLVGSFFAWWQTFRALEFEPHAIESARQIASLVNLGRAALIHSNAVARTSLITTLADQERMRILPRKPHDRFEPRSEDALERRIAEELMQHLSPGTMVAASVNGEKGLWIGFTIDGDAYWLLIDRERFASTDGKTWLIWLLIATALSLAGAAIIARLINQPLKRLSFAASRVRDGDFDASQLDERAMTSEIREVNIGFNRMAQQLAKLEQDRAVMLAGISHDLRTPLARLRLETEMSVGSPDAREHMAADIAQLDAIIDKFLDYARPDHTELRSVLLNEVIDACLYSVQDHEDIRVRLDLPGPLYVQADEVELARVLSNLLENARRYGKTPETGLTSVDISAYAHDDWVRLTVRDHGMGVSPDALPNLVKPFFRDDMARTAATGAGLGLAIVSKTVRRMGGRFALTNANSGGLTAHIELRRAEAFEASD